MKIDKGRDQLGGGPSRYITSSTIALRRGRIASICKQSVQTANESLPSLRSRPFFLPSALCGCYYINIVIKRMRTPAFPIAETGGGGGKAVQFNLMEASIQVMWVLCSVPKDSVNLCDCAAIKEEIN